MSAKNLQDVWAKSVASLEEVVLLAKSHVSAYTRSDGTFVAEHDDKRIAAAAGVPHYEEKAPEQKTEPPKASKPKRYNSIGPDLDFDGASTASIEDVRSGKINNLRFDEHLHNEAEAGHAKGIIRVGPKFFELGAKERDHVLRHEQAHYDSDKIGLSMSIDMADAGVWGGLNKDGTVKNGPNGQWKPDECLTESLALFQTDPEFLKEKYPKAYEIAESYYSTGRIPDSVLGKIEAVKRERHDAAQDAGDRYDLAEKLIREKIKGATDDEEKKRYQADLRKLMLDDEYPPYFTKSLLLVPKRIALFKNGQPVFKA